MNRKRVWTDGYVLCQKALRPYKAFRKGTPETSDSKPFTAGERWLPRFRRRSGVSSSHIVTRRRVSKIRYLRERPQSYNFYYSVLLQLFYFIIVVNLLLCLIDKLNFILDVHVEVMCVCVCGVYTICGFRCPLGTLIHAGSSVWHSGYLALMYWFTSVRCSVSENCTQTYLTC